MKRSIYCCVVFFLMICSIAHSFDYSKKRVMYINSYHPGYQWSDEEQEAAVTALRDRGVTVKVFYMDTKNNTSEEFKRQAGFEAKKAINQFRPHAIISADDNAFKYLVMPFYRDSRMPVVFCGINWDISEYEAPYKNTTGIVEVAHIRSVFQHIKQFVRGDVVAFLGPDVYSERKNAKFYAQFIDGGFDRVEFVSDFDSWKKKYRQLQDEVDLIIFPGPAGIKGWDSEEAARFGLEHLKIPMGTESDEMMPFCLIGASKGGQEQGEYAAQATLEILKGKPPSQIPITSNKKGKLMINIAVADKLGIIFTPALIRSAVDIYGLKEGHD